MFCCDALYFSSGHSVYFELASGLTSLKEIDNIFYGVLFATVSFPFLVIMMIIITYLNLLPYKSKGITLFIDL